MPITNSKVQTKVAVRCSIILPAGEDYSRLSDYLWTLDKTGLNEGYELVVINDRGLEIDEGQLRASLPMLKVLNVEELLNEGQLFDRGVMATRGKYLLLVRDLIDFDKCVLDDAIKDLEVSEEKVSVSAGKNFVLSERFYYVSKGGFKGLFGGFNLGAGQSGEQRGYDFKGKKGTVLLVTCLFEDNFGDILIYETINKKLKDVGFETEMVEVSQSLNKSKLIERANNSDFLYFVGGGIIERGAPEIIKYFDSLHKHILVNYGVVGLSTGKFDYTDFNNSLKLFSEKASFFYTRDEKSIETFRKAGARKLPTAGVDVAFANESLAQFKRNGNIVTASFRNVPYIDITGDLNWSMWSDALRRIGVKSLIWDCNNAQEKLGITINYGDILEQISNSGVIVAMRFHVILAASMMGVLTIPINYCPKVERLAGQLGILDYCLELDDHDKLESTFWRLKSYEKSIRESLQRKVLELKSRANEIIESSIGIMEKSINKR